MVRSDTYWTTITDCNGVVEQELSFDAWGKRRNPVNWLDTNQLPEPMFDRGFTGHEHLYAFGLINMNGRVYDPLMSSFLSVDAFVQSPDNSQNFNRYSYCLNNPLKYTDPSGWLMSRPSGSGGIPPQFKAPQPVAVDGGYQLIEIDGVLYGGCLIDTYAIDNAISSSGSTFSDEKPYFSSDRGFGDCDQERDTPSFNPTINHGGGGGFWTGGDNTTPKEYGVSSNTISYTVSYAGLVTGYNKNLWKKPLSRAQKAINQKKAYNTQKALKAKGITKSVKDIKATKIANLRTGGNALAGLSIGIEALDMAQSRSCNVSNAIGVLAAIGGAFFWEVSLAYMTIETGSYLITGQSFGENIDNWIGKPIFSW